ncbi:hypothetical protein [Flavobacterium sp. CAU 1735]|uniref:hypothetical protein n=1 Tax=Flavobacterium sp. CAU 1735 TaxID=3140361 RepID=UPI00325FEB45
MYNNMTRQQKERIIKELEKSPDFIIALTDTLSTPTKTVIESVAYMHKVDKNNKLGLKTFEDEVGIGYVIEKKITKKPKLMKWKGQRKSKNVEDRRTTKPGRKVVTLKSLASDSEKKRAVAKKKKATGLNGATSTTKTVRVSKAAGTKANGTLKKGHRYVKGGGIVKVTSK